MPSTLEDTIHILGCGAIGYPLAAHLTRAGRPVLAVRIGADGMDRVSIPVIVRTGTETLVTPVETVSLNRLDAFRGPVVITAKANANPGLAETLVEKGAAGPIVLMQNGLGVEVPFVEAGLAPIHRCLPYISGVRLGPAEFQFHAVQPSPIGTVSGDRTALAGLVSRLDTAGCGFRAEPDIGLEVWRKVVVNSVFNSICPLVGADNGLFARSPAALEVAREVIGECVGLARHLGFALEEADLVRQVMRVSSGSAGRLCSTLQDLNAGRPTEIEFMNLELARIAASLDPPHPVPRVEALGRLVRARSVAAPASSASDRPP